MQVTLTKIYLNDKNKEGEPFIDKNGNRYHRCSIKTVEHGNEYLNKNWVPEKELPTISQWKEGDTVEIEVEKNEYNGKIYKNFNLQLGRVTPAKLTELQDYVKSLEYRIVELENLMKNDGVFTRPDANEEDGIEDSGMPF